MNFLVIYVEHIHHTNLCNSKNFISIYMYIFNRGCNESNFLKTYFLYKELNRYFVANHFASNIVSYLPN